MDNKENINTMLVRLFADIMEWEGQALITEEFRDITNNDMHIIDVIGVGKAKNMSSIASQLRITVGTLTIAINNLLKKGYVERIRSQKDRRVVLVSLSEKGQAAYRRHEQFHQQMVDKMLACLTKEEVGTLAKGLSALCNFMNAEMGRFGRSKKQL